MRILEIDLIELHSQLQWSLSDGTVRLMASDVARITESWLTYRQLLARRLSSDQWSQVARVFQTTLVWGAREGDRLGDLDREHIAGWLSRIEETQDILGAGTHHSRAVTHRRDR